MKSYSRQIQAKTFLRTRAACRKSSAGDGLRTESRTGRAAARWGWKRVLPLVVLCGDASRELMLLEKCRRRSVGCPGLMIGECGLIIGFINFDWGK